MISRNYFAMDPMDFNESTAADRVGRRIRRVRESQGMTQTELGKKIGLSADRVQKYENGFRKPKADLLKKIAEALGVSTLAFTDPVVANYKGAMFAFFEMEKAYNLNIKRDGVKLSLVFENGYSGTMNDYLDEWEKERHQVEIELESASSDEERASILHAYEMWKWNFPQGVVAKTEEELKEMRKAKIEEQMKQLQKELEDLNDEGE